MTRGTDQRERVYVRGTCETCAANDKLIYENRAGDLLCSECTRKYLLRNPTPQSCDTCGEEKPVFRNGTTRANVYLCLDCHQKTGYKLDNLTHKRGNRE